MLVQVANEACKVLVSRGLLVAFSSTLHDRESKLTLSSRKGAPPFQAEQIASAVLSPSSGTVIGPDNEWWNILFCGEGAETFLVILPRNNDPISQIF
jgi:hypothetical protein